MLGFKAGLKEAREAKFRYKIWNFKNQLVYGFQRFWRGFDDRFVWNFGPELPRYTEALIQTWEKQGINSHPMDIPYEEWKEILSSLKEFAGKIWREMDCAEPNKELFLKYKQHFFYLLEKYLEDLWD